MSLAAWVARQIADAGTTELGLMRHGQEIAPAGYARQRVEPGQWKLTEDSARAEVSFGPFAEAAEFDGGVLFIDGEPVQVQRHEPPIKIPPRPTTYRGKARVIVTAYGESPLIATEGRAQVAFTGESSTVVHGWGLASVGIATHSAGAFVTEQVLVRLTARPWSAARSGGVAPLAAFEMEEELLLLDLL